MRSLTALTLIGLVAALGVACSNSDEGTPLAFGSSGNGSGANGSGANGSGANGSGATGNAGPQGSGGGTGITFGGSTGAGASAGSVSGGGLEGCAEVSQTTAPLPPVLEFLIDTSRSMDEDAPNSMMSKWEATREALVQAFTGMADGTGTGLIFYPNTASTSGRNCITKREAVRIAPLDMTVRAALNTALENQTPNGATPTHDAYIYALDTLQASTVPGSKYVVLVTDGAPTFSKGCVGGMGAGGGMLAEVDPTPIIQEAAAALAQRGIKTFVIGSPGSESALSALSQIASQGGTALPGCSDMGPNYCHFDMTKATDLAAELNAALAKITGNVISCVYRIPPAPAGKEIDYQKVYVRYTNSAGAVTQIDKEPSMDPTVCTHGWQFSADKGQIQLCADACDLIKTDPSAVVNVVLGCQDRPL